MTNRISIYCPGIIFPIVIEGDSFEITQSGALLIFEQRAGAPRYAFNKDNWGRVSIQDAALTELS